MVRGARVSFTRSSRGGRLGRLRSGCCGRCCCDHQALEGSGHRRRTRLARTVEMGVDVRDGTVILPRWGWNEEQETLGVFSRTGSKTQEVKEKEG